MSSGCGQGAEEAKFCIDHISDIFAEDPIRYSEVPKLLTEIRKRALQYYGKAPLVTPDFVNDRRCNGGQLVRFRGAIQNVQSSELFGPSYSAEMQGGQLVQMTAAFQDCLGCKNDKMFRVVDGKATASRSLYMMSMVPGESDWAALNGDETVVRQISQLELGPESEARAKISGKQLQLVVRIYEELQSEFLVGDIIDFYGIYYNGINLDENANVEDFVLFEHAIYSFPNVHIIEHSILNRNNLTKRPVTPIPSVFESLCQFATSLTGSSTAALYYLSAFVARTYIWQEDLPVPLCSVPFAFLNVRDSHSIIECAKLLAPMVCVLPISAKVLESERLFSSMDHESGILQCGKLQLCRGTVLILDFTHYTTTATPTDKNFVRENVAALQQLIGEQKLIIDYGVYKHRLETDVSVIALCPGVNTYFLKFSALVPFPKSFTDGLDPVTELSSLKSDVLQNFRWYLSECRERLHTVEMGRDEQKIVESFTGIRQQLNTAAPDHFRHLLTLTRIQTVMKGGREMKNATFQELLQSEYKRLNELRALKLI